MDPKAYVYLAISGEQVRGTPGCVLVDQEKQVAKYTLVAELPASIRPHAEQLLDDDDETHHFVMVMTGGSVHVLKHRRDEALADFKEQLVAAVARGDEGAPQLLEE